VIKIIRKAKLVELDNVFNLYKSCIKDLLSKDIVMWDKNYPTRELIKKDIELNNLYVIEKNKNFIGAFVLDEYLDEYWEKVNWKNNNFIGIHLLAIKPDFQGKGYGKKIIKFCEQFAKDNDYESIHLDVFSKNKAAINLYQKFDYKFVQEIYFDFKPAGNRKYYCYEKIIIPKEEK
jgi:ribosomal protein S18 acetylase RimI-like enzyme